MKARDASNFLSEKFVYLGDKHSQQEAIADPAAEKHFPSWLLFELVSASKHISYRDHRFVRYKASVPYRLWPLLLALLLV